MNGDLILGVMCAAWVFIPAAVVAHRLGSAQETEHDPALCSDCLLLGLPAEPMRTVTRKDEQ
jgi:hypothetical protein